MNWYDRLDQGDVWIDAAGVELPIETMDPGYCGRVLCWLHRNAKGIVGEAAWSFANVSLPGEHTMAHHEVEAGLDYEHQDMVADPRAWLLETPLVHALRVRAGWDTCHLPDHPEDCRE